MRFWERAGTASRLASNSVVQYALWLQDLTPGHHERLIRS